MVDLAYVIPAFNAAATVGATVRSVLAQRGPRVMAIVVDDGSTDATGDVARSERDWRVEVVRQPNRGLAAARNTGLEVLGDRAEAVCFLDSDDTIEDGHGRTLCTSLGLGLVERHGHKPRDMAACAYRMVGPELEDLRWTIDLTRADAQWARLLEFNPMGVGGVVVRVDSVRRVGGARPFDESLVVHEDWDLWLRLSAEGSVWGEPVGEPLFNYRIREGSLSRRVEAMWRVGKRVIERALVRGGAPGEPSVPGSDEGVRQGVLRRWTIRHLARAGVAAPELVPGMLVDLDRLGGRVLGTEDRGALLGSLRHALMLEHAVGPDQAMAHEDSWRRSVLAALETWPECHGAIDTLSFNSWDEVAVRLARLLRRDARGVRGRLAHLRPVVAGMGRNGRALATALASRGIAFEWLDEDPAATSPVRGARRLEFESIAPRHLVILTPVWADPLFERLRDSRALVMRASDLIDHPQEIERRRVA